MENPKQSALPDLNLLSDEELVHWLKTSKMNPDYQISAKTVEFDPDAEVPVKFNDSPDDIQEERMSDADLHRWVAFGSGSASESDQITIIDNPYPGWPDTPVVEGSIHPGLYDA